ncbi:N-acetyllactosaminide beta-1,3-N-acetylglucosaminyltransferase 2-like [Gouania willdenowi]|uniref:Hexosyltransferase n=1 Tax=Gouania willdenowi TaxID=441366 RepID=A0A8C5I3K5_GOUWI|nr:N-acetyllactosaminide beta-1,3-N-acetylglucosaminyltransferase 2-like [Gouania willdenowi]
MATCFCHWRNLLICVCTSCTSLILMFLLTGYIILCLSMQSKSISLWEPNNLFVASGVLQIPSFAPLPKTFWDINFQNAYWNKLQRTIDENFNPILNIKAPRKPRRTSFDDLLIKQSFSKIRNSESMRKIFEELPEQMQEFVRYMQRRDYPLLLQPREACGVHAKDEKEPPLLLFAIKTSEMNIKNRIAIRKTWGKVGWAVGLKPNSTEQVGGYIRRVFLLGKENTDSMDLSSLLRMENEYYGDMLQWDFQDTFFNLTLKDVLFWDWFSKSCKQIAFVFKGDDDIFVNTPKMVAYLQEQRTKLQAMKTMDEFVVGDVIESAIPSRSSQSKYFIPDNFYNGLYPRYAGGGGVVYSGQLIKRLHNISKRVHLFPIDDVYVGMCILRLNTSPVHHPAFLTFDFKEKKSLCSYHTILLVHKRSPSEVIKLWDDLKKTQTKCQHVPLREEQKMIVSAIAAIQDSQILVDNLFL